MSVCLWGLYCDYVGFYIEICIKSVGGLYRYYIVVMVMLVVIMVMVMKLIAVAVVGIIVVR